MQERSIKIRERLFECIHNGALKRKTERVKINEVEFIIDNE
jgi:hypothetical protein